MTSPSPRGLPKALVPTTSLQILTASLLAGLMGKVGFWMIPSAPRASPKVSTHYLLSAPWPYLLRAAHCIQQAGYGCPAETTLVFLGTSTAPLGTALPSSAELHCGALNHWPQPHMPQSQQLEPLHQPPSDGCHLPVANAQVSGSLLTIPQLGQVPGHLWRDPTCLRQPWDSWVSRAPNTHMHRHTHTSLLPVDAKPLAQATLLEWEQPLMLLPGLSCSVAAHIPGRGRLQEGSSCWLRRHLPGLLVGSGTPLGERLRNAVQGASLGELQQGAGRTYPARLPAALPGVPEVGQGCWQLWSCPCPMPPCSAAVTKKQRPCHPSALVLLETQKPGWRSKPGQE